MNFEAIKDDLEWVASTEQGRHVIWELLSFCKVYHDLGGESHEVYKNLGRREVGLHLLSLVDQLDDDLIFDMMKEAKYRDKISQEKENERTRTDIDGDYGNIIDDLIGGNDNSSGGELSGHSRGGAIF